MSDFLAGAVIGAVTGALVAVVLTVGDRSLTGLIAVAATSCTVMLLVSSFLRVRRSRR